MQNSVLGFIQYNVLNRILEKYQTKKLAMNSTALIHATSTVLIRILGNHNLMRMNTGGYFLFDMLYLLRNRKMNLLHGMYMYHHTAVIYYMTLNHKQYNWVNNVCIAELSNIPTYFVYYYLKKKMKYYSGNRFKNIGMGFLEYHWRQR
jgi:hypothetical protein